MTIKFTKMQSAGNDFVLVEDSGAIRDYPAFARFACNRHFGIGSDGVLVLTRDSRADVGMIMYNPDGSEAEACGNGLRCLVKYTFDRGFVITNRMTVATAAGVRTACIIEADTTGTIIETSMGYPVFEAGKIPLIPGSTAPGKVLNINAYLEFPLPVEEYDLRLAIVSMGNPHAVYFTSRPVNEFPLDRIGPLVENAAAFPQKTNFEVARVLSRGLVEARVWERGAGETLACGSGASAIGVVSQLSGAVDRPVAIRLPGGELEVNWNKAEEVYLKGKAVEVFSGQLSSITF